MEVIGLGHRRTPIPGDRLLRLMEIGEVEVAQVEQRAVVVAAKVDRFPVRIGRTFEIVGDLLGVESRYTQLVWLAVINVVVWIVESASEYAAAVLFRGLSQADLAQMLETSQGAVTRIESGKQNLTLETLAKISETLDSELVALGSGGATNGAVHLRIDGGKKLSGAIDVKTSKNAAVALLCASLLNKGTTTLRNLARIEEVNRILEVLDSIGVKTRWLPGSADLEFVAETGVILIPMMLSGEVIARKID